MSVRMTTECVSRTHAIYADNWNAADFCVLQYKDVEFYGELARQRAITTAASTKQRQFI